MSISCCQSGWLFLPVPVPCRAGERGPIRLQRRWRIASFLRRTCRLESDCDCGELPSAKCPMRTLLWRVSAVMYPVFYSVTASGSFRRPAALGLLLRFLTPASQHRACRGPRFRAPSGLGSSRNKFAIDGTKRRARLLSGPSQKADLRPWEPDPLARLCPV